MRFCNSCKRFTPGEPMFCNFCGSTYDLKLCHSRHPNPRNAEVCSQCGSREFSRPAPELPLMFRGTGPLLKYLPAACLILVSAYIFVELLREILSDIVNAQLLHIAFFVAMCWWLYIQAADFLSGLFGKVKHPFRGKKKDSHGHGH